MLAQTHQKHQNHHHLRFNSHFPGKPGLAGSRLIIRGVKASFLQARCPSCHPTNIIKAVKETVIQTHQKL